MGTEKQTAAFKATKGGELQETTADTAEGSNNDNGMTEDLMWRLAERGGKKRGRGLRKSQDKVTSELNTWNGRENGGIDQITEWGVDDRNTREDRRREGNRLVPVREPMEHSRDDNTTGDTRCRCKVTQENAGEHRMTWENAG